MIHLMKIVHGKLQVHGNVGLYGSGFEHRSHITFGFQVTIQARVAFIVQGFAPLKTWEQLDAAVALRCHGEQENSKNGKPERRAWTGSALAEYTRHFCGGPSLRSKKSLVA